jgi:hypothetical protein
VSAVMVPATERTEAPKVSGNVPRPDWFDKPHEEWPAAAKEFYRLLLVGARRRQERLARQG